MKKNPIFDFSHLSAVERIELAQDLWDSLTPEDAGDVPLSEAQRAELGRRLEAARRNPKEGYSWAEVREHVLETLEGVRAKSA
ncbi:MAG TPA: addiction module protein [Longimicrobium sp.]|jgi:putative addiction module component (TIGR02574 family)